jgi:hypothetical protein
VPTVLTLRLTEPGNRHSRRICMAPRARFSSRPMLTTPPSTSPSPWEPTSVLPGRAGPAGQTIRPRTARP